MNILYCLLCIYLTIFCLAIKNNFTFANRNFIRNAIFIYNTRQLHNSIINNTDEDFDFIDASVMESYRRTLFRLYDWGYKNIVPSDVFDKIAPIIEEVIDNDK